MVKQAEAANTSDLEYRAPWDIADKRVHSDHSCQPAAGTIIANASASSISDTLFADNWNNDSLIRGRWFWKVISIRQYFLWTPTPTLERAKLVNLVPVLLFARMSPHRHSANIAKRRRYSRTGYLLCAFPNVPLKMTGKRNTQFWYYFRT